MIVLKVTAIVLALTLLGIGLYLAYKKLKEWGLELWEYISSGQLWEDLMGLVKKSFGWLSDFGGWIWDKLVDFGKWLFVELPVRFAKWVWESLVKFGNWLYNEYIDPYIV